MVLLAQSYILIDHPKNQFMLISPTWLPAKSQSQQITNEKKAASGKIVPNHSVNDNGGHSYVSVTIATTIVVNRSGGSIAPPHLLSCSI